MTLTVSTAVTWRVPRESHEFVGPIAVTATADGESTPLDPGAVQFAVLLEGTHPGDDDWVAPAMEPDGDGIGVAVESVDAFGRYGIWVKITAEPYSPVLDPDRVGWIERP